MLSSSSNNFKCDACCVELERAIFEPHSSKTCVDFAKLTMKCFRTSVIITRAKLHLLFPPSLPSLYIVANRRDIYLLFVLVVPDCCGRNVTALVSEYIN